MTRKNIIAVGTAHELCVFIKIAWPAYTLSSLKLIIRGVLIIAFQATAPWEGGITPLGGYNFHLHVTSLWPGATGVQLWAKWPLRRTQCLPWWLAWTRANHTGRKRTSRHSNREWTKCSFQFVRKRRYNRKHGVSVLMCCSIGIH